MLCQDFDKPDANSLGLANARESPTPAATMLLRRSNHAANRGICLRPEYASDPATASSKSYESASELQITEMGDLHDPHQYRTDC
jgi:hypothetical protein